MSNAIASIAIHLPADACDCPLCATHFDSASALQARVSSAAQRLAPALLAQEDALRSLSAARDTRVTELQQLRAMQSAIRLARAGLDTEHEERVRLLAHLHGAVGDERATPSTIRTRLADAIAALSASRYRKLRWQTHRALGGPTLNTEHSRAVRARDAAQRALDAATRASADLATALERAKADEVNANAIVGAGRGIVTDEIPAMLQEAEATSRRIQEDVNSATQALTNADAFVGALEAEQAGLRARL